MESQITIQDTYNLLQIKFVLLHLSYISPFTLYNIQEYSNIDIKSISQKI